MSRTIPIALILAAISLSACEDKSPPPASAHASNTPLGGLADNPNSIPGKSAAMGRGVAAKVQGAQDAAANMANEGTGQSANEVVLGGLKFAIPSGWKSVKPSSDMVKATYMIGSGASQAQCNFSTAGGDIASNINRWKSQMIDSSGQPVEGDITEETVNGIQVTIYKATGTYAAMGGQKQPNTAFRGAIVKAPAANVFVRLTGPSSSIGEVERQWESVVTSFTK